MATFDISTVPTLADVINHNSPAGGVNDILDVLAYKKRPLIEEGYWVRASDNTSHEMLINSTRPDATPVRYNMGAPFVNPTQTPKKEQLMRLETNFKIDVRILEKSNDPVKYFTQKKKQAFEGMIDTFAKTALTQGTFGNSATNELSIDGFLKRRSTLGANSVTIAAGSTGTGTLGSILVIKWGEEGAFFLHPKDGDRTIREKDVTAGGKEITTYDANGNPYQVLMVNWSWEFGIGIADETCVQRVCNIQPSGTNSFFDDATNPFLGEDKLSDALARLPGGNTDNAAIYVGPVMYAQMMKRVRRGTSPITLSDMWGRQMLSFYGVPVLRDDFYAFTESTIS